MSKLNAEDVNRAEEIVQEMQELLDEFRNIIRHAESITYERFHAYPEGHIEMAISDDHNWMGKNMFTLQGLVENMRSEVEYEEEDEEEYDEEEDEDA